MLGQDYTRQKWSKNWLRNGWWDRELKLFRLEGFKAKKVQSSTTVRFCFSLLRVKLNEQAQMDFQPELHLGIIEGHQTGRHMLSA